LTEAEQQSDGEDTSVNESSVLETSASTADEAPPATDAKPMTRRSSVEPPAAKTASPVQQVILHLL